MSDHDPGKGRHRSSGAPPRPELLASVEQLLAAGGATWTAGSDALKAFRILLFADISLARSAFGRTLAMTGVAIAFGASCWLLLMAALIVFLSRQLGLPWSLSLLACALLSGGIAGWAIWKSQKYFADTRLRASRRQLARMGIGELADFMPQAGSAESSEHAANRVASATAETPVKKGLGVDITPP